MNRDQWASIETLFAKFSELPSHDRPAALAGIPDDDVRHEVASLLDRTGAGDTVAAAIGAMASRVDTGDFKDRRVGPYRLASRLGQGGQGAVFEAWRDDGAFEQRVAIKVVKWEIDGDAARVQFRNERQILAGLEHPHIARLLDGGQTPSGTPYLVMEFIEGQPLTVAARDWPLRRKLELFLQVAGAVSYAHANLIVHRDLKPGNILVTQDGTPKLLDFGIAKLLSTDSQRTQTMGLALTPDYASPEQVRGEKITTASDVYSLGVVLYQLLTGHLPVEIKSGSFTEIVWAVCHAVPPPARVSADLDNILAMALRKEPERRYASVRDFAEDIERSLSNRTVRARSDTLLYRTGKFVRRNRASLVAAMLIALALIGGLIESQRQARRAERRFQQVRKLANTFLFDFEGKISNLPGATEARRMVVTTALQYLTSLAQDAGSDQALLEEVFAAYLKVGQVQMSPGLASLGDHEGGMKSFQMAAAIGERALKNKPGDGAWMRKTADSYRALSNLQFNMGNTGPAIQYASRCIELMNTATQLRLDPVPDYRLLGSCYLDLGEAQATTDGVAALASYRHLLDNRLPLLKLAPGPDSNYRVAKAYIELALGQQDVGDLNGALESLKAAETLAVAATKEAPRAVSFKLGLTYVYSTFAGLHADWNFPNLGDNVRAASYFRKGASLVSELIAQDANAVELRKTMGFTLAGLSRTLLDIDASESAVRGRESVAMFAWGDRSDIQRNEAGSLGYLALANGRLGKRDESLAGIRESVKIFEANTPKPRVWPAAGDLAEAYADQGKLELQFGERDRAAESFRYAIELIPAAIPAPRSLNLYFNISKVQRTVAAGLNELGLRDRAAEIYRRNLDLWTEWRNDGPKAPFADKQLEESTHFAKAAQP